MQTNVTPLQGAVSDSDASILVAAESIGGTTVDSQVGETL